MMKNGIILICLSVFCCNLVKAQDVLFTPDHIQNPYLYNPAKAGDNDNFAYLDSVDEINVFVSHRSLWLREANAGNQNISFDMPFNSKNNTYFGIGGAVYNERAHILNRTGVMLSAAFHFSGAEKNVMASLGVHSSFLSQNINSTNGTIKHLDDEVINDPAWNGSFFNMGLGGALLFKGKKMQQGRIKKELSLDFGYSNFLSSGSDQNINRYNHEMGLKPHFLGGTSLSLYKENKYRFQFPVKVFWEQGLPNQYNLGSSFIFYFKDTTEFGIRFGAEVQFYGSEYSSSPGMSTFLGLELFSNYSLTAFYEFPTAISNSYTLGLQANIRFYRNNKKKRKSQTTQVKGNSVSKNFNSFSNNDSLNVNAQTPKEPKSESNSSKIVLDEDESVNNISSGNQSGNRDTNSSTTNLSQNGEKSNEFENANSQKEINNEYLGVSANSKDSKSINDNQEQDGNVDGQKNANKEKLAEAKQKPEEHELKTEEKTLDVTQTNSDIVAENDANNNDLTDNADNSASQDDENSKSLNDEGKTCWVISCGVFKYKNGAESKLSEINKKWPNSGYYVISNHEEATRNENYFRVFVGPFNSKNEAKVVNEELQLNSTTKGAFFKSISNCSAL